MAYRLLILPGDNEELRALPSQLASDIEARVLDSANDALWEVRNEPPEAILADIDLPGMGGLDLAEILPNFGVPTRIVLWSRTPNAKAAEQAAGHGVHTFINGPVTFSDLQATLYAALRQAKEAPEPEPEPVAAPEPPAPERTQRAVRLAPPRPTSPRPAPPPEPVRKAAPPTPPPEPARKPATSPRQRSGSLVLTAENLGRIRSRIDSLSQDVGSQCILLANRAGMVLSEVGITAGFPTMILLPLLSTSFSTAGQISQILREDDSTALYMHEGQRYDIYCFDILQSFMLVIVFDKGGIVTAKIGSVWVYAKRAIRDMQELLG